MPVFLVIAAFVAGTTPAAALEPSLSETTTKATGTILSSLKTKSSSSDPRYFSNSVWSDGTPECFRCTMGPATLSAVYSLNSGFDDQPKKDAIASLDKAIKDHQRPDGSFGPPAPGEGGPAIQTVEFANLLASTYLYLGLGLDMAHRRSWGDSLTKASDYLIMSGNTRYYINGNINLAFTVALDLTYRITNLTRFKDAATASYEFTVNPPQDRWKGFGLKITKAPTKDDGSDGTAYLAESGGGAPGYDPAYAIFQTDIASMWYLTTGDERAKRLTNLLLNQIWSRVRTSDWTIDVSGGTRRTTNGLRYRFAVSAVPVLSLKGGRDDLRTYLKPMMAAALKDYQNTTSYANAGNSYNYGIELAPSVMIINSTLFV